MHFTGTKDTVKLQPCQPLQGEVGQANRLAEAKNLQLSWGIFIPNFLNRVGYIPKVGMDGVRFISKMAPSEARRRYLCPVTTVMPFG